MITQKELEDLLKKAKRGERDWSKLLSADKYSVDLMWRLYGSAVLPKDVGRTQYMETRRAFLAGYFEGFKAVTEYAAALSEDEACRFLTKLQRDINGLLEQLLKEHQ